MSHFDNDCAKMLYKNRPKTVLRNVQGIDKSTGTYGLEYPLNGMNTNVIYNKLKIYMGLLWIYTSKKQV